MPKQSTWTELLGPALLEQIDEVGEAIKELVGWPPLGVAELSRSGARGREKADAAMLADLFARVGPETAVQLLAATGPALVDQFGERVIMEAMQAAAPEMRRQAEAISAVQGGDDGGNTR